VISRREFLQKSGLPGVSLVMPRIHGPIATASETWRLVNPNRLERFVDPLPLLPVAKSSGVQGMTDNSGVTLPDFPIEIRKFEGPVHRDLKPTRQ
jgi:spore coat protein A